MKHGDFTKLAKFYINRPGYSTVVLECLKNHIFNTTIPIDGGAVADIGAGTGKLTENLAAIGCRGFAIEPNVAMRAEGENLFLNNNKFIWKEGTAEETGLDDDSIQWALMGSSFHWADSELAVKEFYRILVPGGYFTAIWNPRDIESSELHKRIEEVIYTEVPNMRRVSSGKSITTEQMKEKLLSGGYFKDILFIESPHVEVMTKERYMSIWKSVNDIQVQAGEEGFKRILSNINDIICNMDMIEVPYLSRSWTVQSCK